MKRVLIWLMVALLIVAFAGVGCNKEAAEEEVVKAEETVEEVKELKDLKIGYVMPYLQGWFGYWDQGWNLVMDKYGVETETILTNWDPEAELQAAGGLS